MKITMATRMVMRAAREPIIMPIMSVPGVWGFGAFSGSETRVFSSEKGEKGEL